MITEEALYWSQWQQLTSAQQRGLFEQMLRYFVHPLWQVGTIAPLKNHQGLQTWQVALNGRQFYFEPGQLANEQQVAVAPFLISANAIPANHYFLGTIDPVSGQPITNQFALKHYQQEIADFLQRPTHTLNPFAQPTEWASEHLTFVDQDQVIAVYQRQFWAQSDLQQQLRREGGNLPTANQWQAAAFANQTSVAWKIDDKSGDSLLGLGLRFNSTMAAELLTDPALIQPNPFHRGPDKVGLAPVAAELPVVLTADYYYRTVLNVQLD